MKRCISLLLIIAIFLGMNTVSFAQGRVILALGDSITAGYGLNDREAECFVSLVAFSGDTVINKAVDGNEAPDIINQLTDTENENYITPEDIASADIVTITCGGNDMMALLYEKIAAEYKNVHPRKQTIEPHEVLGKLAEGNVYAMVAALNVLDEDDDAYYMNDGEFDVRLDAFIENLLYITEYIKSINPRADIVIATQYNPYVEFTDAATLDVLYFGMEEGAEKLNAAIANNAKEHGYIVADVKSAFDAYRGEEDLYNANPDFDNINLDFHPSKAGHELIAEVFGKVMNVHRLGVENQDGTYSLPENTLGFYITSTDGDTRFVNAGVYEAKEGDFVCTVFMNVTMAEGAQVKISGDNGLRFIALVDRSEFDAAGYGMKISCEGSEEEIFVDAASWQDDTCFTVAIENIAVENYTRNYTAMPFVRVIYDDGEEKIICSSQSVTRSIFTVAKGLLESGNVHNETVREALQGYINTAA